ncbi:hypothetical protein DPMN_057323 [Dreissena polymorpha]|uniref:Uncharacterized protein n=1 Tax=Dreissena polymorpha TaxID=45954 RepID=A0A9D4HE40_DREPO|nr:hypothetical protein DPMN_057323 [Dreissena polymorpha]
MKVDFYKKLLLPSIVQINPRPEEAYESKNAKYAELLEEACNQLGWRVWLFP